MIIGIDNGLSGGIVALSPLKGLAPITKVPLPVCKIWQPPRKETKGKFVNEIDTRRLILALDEIGGNRAETKVFFEHCPFHADQASIMRSMAMSAGKILAVLEAKGYSVTRVLSFDWQPEILGKVPRGRTKEYAAAAAAALWPEESWVATPRHEVACDGLIDAALIAEFGRRKTYESGQPQSPLVETSPAGVPVPRGTTQPELL
jgi:hypothetical protein